jgi:hypothetical protein
MAGFRAGICRFKIARKGLEKSQRMEGLKLHGQLLRHDLTERMWIFELGIPFEKAGYDTYHRLLYLKEKLEGKDVDSPSWQPLENDNAFCKAIKN